MAFGFPAYHTESYSPGRLGTGDLRSAAHSALIALGWILREDGDVQMTVSTGANLRSWGEKVLINFLPDNTISVTSRCMLPTQCFDWGKNKANVTKFLSELQKHANSASA